MKKLSLFLLCFLLFFILSPVVMGQSPTSSPVPSPASGEDTEKHAVQMKMRNITVIITLLIIILFVSFAIFRVRAKLKNRDSHKKPLTGLASKNAGIIFKDRSSDEE
jgi:Na+/H+ antiporter NhaC